MKCTCMTKIVQPNATPTTPFFPGIVRFAHTEIIKVDESCGAYGYMFEINLAADLRYGD